MVIALGNLPSVRCARSRGNVIDAKSRQWSNANFSPRQSRVVASVLIMDEVSQVLQVTSSLAARVHAAFQSLHWTLLTRQTIPPETKKQPQVIPISKLPAQHKVRSTPVSRRALKASQPTNQPARQLNSQLVSQSQHSALSSQIFRDPITKLIIINF